MLFQLPEPPVKIKMPYRCNVCGSWEGREQRLGFMEALCLTGGSEVQRREVSGHTAKLGMPAGLLIPYLTSGGLGLGGKEPSCPKEWPL